MTCVLPIDESGRQQALLRYDILDTVANDDFGALTRLAATVCSTPMALVSLVDGDGWRLGSSVGLARAPHTREASFCTLVVREGRFLSVEDALRDEATARIAGAYSPQVRFYAGAPLTTPDAYHIGALGVMDTVPRTLDTRQCDALMGLAQQVVTHLELRRHARALAETVQQLRAAEHTILHMAHHDALTDLPGRFLFNDRLEYALRRAVRHHETLAVMFLDLDGFKAVNDTHGHPAGDRLLQDVALALQSSLRRSDTVARMGGDEFAIVCPDLRDAENIDMIARKLLAAVRSCNACGMAISASIGIAVYPYDGATAETLLFDADSAMYRAKRRGKDTYAFSSISGRKGAIGRMA
ncbi:MAG TPA: sensor domain-containing diguanylate cyclase [Armatimonadota bacterium]|jgi:diguanylate cyclase (GGDEF)-like protein